MTCLSVCLSVCLFVCPESVLLHMAEWIRVPFAVMSVVGRGMGVLDGDSYRRREGTVLRVNLGRPIVINGNSVA